MEEFCIGWALVKENIYNSYAYGLMPISDNFTLCCYKIPYFNALSVIAFSVTYVMFQAAYFSLRCPGAGL